MSHSFAFFCPLKIETWIHHVSEKYIVSDIFSPCNINSGEREGKETCSSWSDQPGVELEHLHPCGIPNPSAGGSPQFLHFSYTLNATYKYFTLWYYSCIYMYFYVFTLFCFSTNSWEKYLSSANCLMLYNGHQQMSNCVCQICPAEQACCCWCCWCCWKWGWLHWDFTKTVKLWAGKVKEWAERC